MKNFSPMNRLIWTLFLAIIWLAIMGQFTIQGVIVSLIVGSAVLAFTRTAIEGADTVVTPKRYFKSLLQFIFLIAFLAKEIWSSSVSVAKQVLSPNLNKNLSPCVIGIEVDSQRDLHNMFFAQMITLTPGTLSLDFSDDNKTLYIHSLWTPDNLEEYRQEIKDAFETKILEVFS